jgi:hypothetical protein
MGLYLTHKQDWNGWNGRSQDNYTLDLDLEDLEGSQQKIDEYIKDHSLFNEYPSGHTEGIEINLVDLLKNIE